MTTARALVRLTDIKQAVVNIRTMLAGLTEQQAEQDFTIRAAFERFLEIVSEASRHIPEEWRQHLAPHIPWKDIANIGNVLRHTYHLVEFPVLWNIYLHDLGPFEAAIDAMIEAYGPVP